MQMTGEKDGARRGTRDFSRDFFDHSRHRPLRMTSTKSSPRQMFTSEAAQKIITKKMRQKKYQIAEYFSIPGQEWRWVHQSRRIPGSLAAHGHQHDWYMLYLLSRAEIINILPTHTQTHTRTRT